MVNGLYGMNGIYHQGYVVGIYCRLSKEDGDKLESDSIAHQRELLENYCNAQNWRIYSIYQDDGYTGLNQDRPDFQRMMRDVEAHRINLVITKDYSRLGRNHIETSRLTEEFFPRNGVRYIALNDGIDTEQENEITLRILKDYFSGQKLTDIKPIHIEEFLKAEAQKGKSQSSLAKLRGMMFQIMKKAVANDLIAKNPVEYAYFIKASTQSTDKESFTAKEIAIMMRELPRNRIGHSIRLMLGTGIRTQELLALEPKHISPDGSTLRIEQAVKLVNGTPVLGSPKSKTSYRTIPVPDSIRPSAIFLRSTTEKYIWSNHRDGRFCNPSTFRKQFREELEHLEGVRVLTPHSTRHTFVSQLQAAGVPMETIKSLTGHASMEMTEHYLHVQDDVKREAASKLNHIFGGRTA